MAERRSSVTRRGSVSKQQQPPTLPVSAAELSTAFAFFDRTGRGYITADDLRARLAPLYPQLTDKDFHTMTQSKEHFTAHDLTLLLTLDTQPPHDAAQQHAPHSRQHGSKQQQLSGSGPASQSDVLLEAFQLFDPQGRCYVDTEHLAAVLVRLGLTEVTRGDIQVLIEQNDRDRDGKIGLNDFKRMLGAQNSSGTSRTSTAG